MPELEIRESYVNQTKGYRYGNSGWYEPYTDHIGSLFLSLQREFGRCVSKVYIDVPVAFYPATAKAIGWLFEKKKEHTDCSLTYIQETWVEVRKNETIPAVG